jgi:hypothetical protein
MAIRVKTNNNTTTVRVGQQNAIKVVASNQSAAVGTVDQMSSVGDVNITARSTNTFLMYNGSEYVHVDAAEVLDLADTVSDVKLKDGCSCITV